MRSVILLPILLVVYPCVQAATPLAELRYSPDMTITLSGTLLADQDVGADDLIGSVTLLDIGPIPTTTDLTAYHLLSNGEQQLAFDTTVTLGVVSAEPRDVVRYDGINYTLDFDGSTAGIPAGVKIDAISRTLDGDLLLSFDTSVNLGVVTADDEDLVRFDGAFSLILDASAAGIATGLDLNGAHELFNGHLLLSFNSSGTVSGTVFDDEDVLEFDPIGATWELAYGGSAQHATWAAADMDALWANESASTVPGYLQFSTASYSIGENNPSVTITITRSGGSIGAVSVDYTTGDGSATSGNDYSNASGTLNWADGDTTDKTFNVPILDDALVEGNETVNLSLSGISGGAAIGTPNNATLTIEDNETPVAGAFQFSTANYNIVENGLTATITVVRSGGSTGIVSVDFATSDTSTTAGNDYTTTVGTLNWVDGDTADKTFSVPILEDALIEGDEKLNLSLSNPTGSAAIGTPGNATLNITDNDGPVAGILQFSNPTYTASEKEGSATITVVRNGGSTGVVSVSFTSSDGSATDGNDYIITSGTLNWADGDSAAKSFIVPILSDALTENDEIVNLTLSTPIGSVALGTTATAELTIVDSQIEITPIPTLSQWVMLLLSGLIGWIGIRKQRNNLVPRR